MHVRSLRISGRPCTRTCPSYINGFPGEAGNRCVAMLSPKKQQRQGWLEWAMYASICIWAAAGCLTILIGLGTWAHPKESEGPFWAGFALCSVSVLTSFRIWGRRAQEQWDQRNVWYCLFNVVGIVGGFIGFILCVVFGIQASAWEVTSEPRSNAGLWVGTIFVVVASVALSVDAGLLAAKTWSLYRLSGPPDSNPKQYQRVGDKSQTPAGQPGQESRLPAPYCIPLLATDRFFSSGDV
jgi:hypothetical protein